MKRVTGIGGVFFKANDPDKIIEWYKKHLGINIKEGYGYNFKWHEMGNTGSIATTAWGPFKKDTAYFSPSKKDFMFNYRVDNLEELLKVLKDEGIEIVGEIEYYEYGKFGWIMDPENNKIELWEPIDGILK